MGHCEVEQESCTMSLTQCLALAKLSIFDSSPRLKEFPSSQLHRAIARLIGKYLTESKGLFTQGKDFVVLGHSLSWGVRPP